MENGKIFNNLDDKTTIFPAPNSSLWLDDEIGTIKDMNDKLEEEIKNLKDLIDGLTIEVSDNNEKTIQNFKNVDSKFGEIDDAITDQMCFLSKLQKSIEKELKLQSRENEAYQVILETYINMPFYNRIRRKKRNQILNEAIDKVYEKYSF